MRLHFKLTVYANTISDARDAVYAEAAKFLNVKSDDCKSMLDIEFSVNNKFETTEANEGLRYEVVAQANLKNSVVRPNVYSSLPTPGSVTYGL